MNPAAWPLPDPRATRLLRIDPRRRDFVDGTIGDLRQRLRAGDLLVVNDAATLPAALRGVTASGAAVEARLAGEGEGGAWRAVLLGAGDWRTRTEDRPPAPALAVGEALRFAGLTATIAEVDESSPRLVSLVFEERGDALWRALYRAGRPVQYAHTAAPLPLWQVQTAYAARPWAAEQPSAGRALSIELLLEARHGVAQCGLAMPRIRELK